MKKLILLILFFQSATAIANEKMFTYKPSDYCSVKDKSDEKNESNYLNLAGLFGFPVGPSYQQFTKGLADKILRPFTSDGCSVSPDGIPATEKNQLWVECCVAHDTAYWLGGTKKEKKIADENLGKCIKQKGYSIVGSLFKNTVDKTGSAKTSLTFRWGYGWNYNRPYTEITTQEEAQVQLLYKKNKNDVSSFLAATTQDLDLMCTTHDYVLDGFGPFEKAIYNYLNSNLINNDTILTVKERNFNLEKKEFEIQLASCPEPLTLTISRKNKTVIAAQKPSQCDGVYK